MTAIGAIGLGRAGLRIALNLRARGHEVIGYCRSGSTELAAAGGTVATSLGEVAERATLILMCLPHSTALTAVTAELAPGLGPDHVVVELGSHPLADKQRALDLCTSRGARFLDGEISGTPAMVAARSAVLLLAGEPGAADRATAVLRDVSEHVRYAGAFGAATKLKLVANVLVAVHTVAAAEAVLLAERAGIDMALAIDVLGLGSGSSTMLKTRAPAMVARRFVDPAPGPVGMLAHYLDAIAALAATTNTQLPLFDIAAELFRSALADGRKDQDIACVIELLDAQKGRHS